MMPSVDELEQAYRHTYRRLVIGMVAAYAVVLVLALAVVVSGPLARLGAANAVPVSAPVQSANAGGQAR